MDFKEFFQDKVILVLGGTGSIGNEIISQVLKFNPKTIRVLSNSENELWETKLKFENFVLKLRFLLGDIRNYQRVERAVQGTDYVFNAAAIKHVPLAEYNPIEAVNVNIHGVENVIEACFKNKVKRLIHISTDKAVNPTTVMGATKMLGERLCVLRNSAKGNIQTKISCVRFGNVLGSRGSLIPLIKEQIENGNFVTLTHEKMSRFFLSISQAVDLILKSTLIAEGGEIFVLKMPTILIKDLIEIIIADYCPIIGKDPKDIKIKIIGARLGEKLDEELISPIEFSTCQETENMFIIHPLINIGYKTDNNNLKVDDIKEIGNKKFSNTTKNANPLSKEEIRIFLNNYNLL